LAGARTNSQVFAPPHEKYMSVVDSYLFELGWLFFGAWSVIVAVFLVAAFGRDLLGAVAERGRAKRKDSCQMASATGAK
jgi:hypothetical protein